MSTDQWFEDLRPSIAETAAGPVQYVDRGVGDPVLFVHGTPGGCDQGALMAEFLLEGGFRTISVSRPGYLQTPLSDGYGSPQEQAALELALMDALDIERFGLLCWSGGGPSSYTLAARHPDRVAALVAIAALSGSYDFKPGLDERLLFTHVGKLLVAGLEKLAPNQLVSSMLNAEGELTKEQLKELAEYVESHNEPRQFVLRLSRTLSLRTTGVDNDIEHFRNLSDLPLSGITVPTLLIHGTVDTDVAPRFTEHAAEQIPQAEVIRVELGTHLAVWTDFTHQALQSRITEFLGARLAQAS